VVRYVTGRYLRGQAILGLAVGVSVFALLSIMRVGYAIPLAAIAGLGEFVPIAGPWLAGIIGILVVLATAPAKAPWIALGYILIQLLQNNLLSPRVQGRQMGIHPAIVIVLTMLAASFLGVLGFVLVLPLTMTTVEVVRYARLRAAAGASPIIVPSGHDDVSSSPD
jgi:predicted PurR-regulated permease PerM